MKLSDRYYTGREVQRLLSITEPALRTLVTNKKLRKVTPPGRKTGVYLKSEVDTYAEKWLAFLSTQEPPKSTFEIATLEDMNDVYDIAKRAISPTTMDAELRRSWLEKNPESCYVVKHDNKVVAFFHLLPVKHHTLMAFMDGKIRGWNITADDVELFERGKKLECLAIIASEPDVSEDTRMHYVALLIRGLVKEVHKLGRNGVELTTIYATSETPTGIAMSFHAGMEQFGDKIGKRIKFKMDVNSSKSFIAQSYRNGYEEWNKAQLKQKRGHDKGSRLVPSKDSEKTTV